MDMTQLMQELPPVNTRNTVDELSRCENDSIDQLSLEIQEIIIKKVESLSDLLQCRSVSRNWSEFATKELKTRSHVIRFWPEEEEHDRISFLATMENHREFPFTNFNFDFNNFPTSDGDDHLSVFLDLYGLYVQHLDVRLWARRNMNLDEIVAKLLTNIPRMLHQTANLTQLDLTAMFEIKVRTEQGISLIPLILPKLKILRLMLYHPHNQDSWTEFLVKLRDASPNLEKLSLTPSSDDNDFSGLSARLNIFRNTPRIDLTAYVDLSDQRMLEFAEALRNPHPIQLTELTFSLSNSNSEMRNMEDHRTHFQKMLETQSPTLKFFELRIEEVEKFSIPPLQVLESLALQFFGVSPGPPITPFTPGHFPNLQSLTLWGFKGNWPVFATGQEKFPNVTELYLMDFEGHEALLYHWDVIFPALRRLELVDVGAEAIRMFFLQFRFLPHLRLVFNIASGEEAKERMISNALDRPLRIPKEMSQIPALAYLENLQTLELRGPYSMVKTIVKITGSGFFKPLKCLTLSECHGITDVDKEILLSVHQSVKWVK